MKPEVAAEQMEREANAAATTATTGPVVTTSGAADPTSSVGPSDGSSSSGTHPTVKALLLTRFHASATLNPTRLSRDADMIASSVVQHLTALMDANVKITLEVEADLPSGAPENVVRTVTENCRTLKIDSHGFEES